jgi:shikimate kinase
MVACPRSVTLFAGISCVGKTTIGAQLASLLQCRLFDLDIEIEAGLLDTSADDEVMQ